MRTELGKANQSRVSGKWSITFVSYRGDPGSEYVCSEVESAPVFENEDAAWAGGERAMDHLEAHGRYPNMCEAF